MNEWSNLLNDCSTSKTRNFLYLVWLKSINNNIEDIDWCPGEEEQNADTNQHLVCLLPPPDLPGGGVGGAGDAGLGVQGATHSEIMKISVYIQEKLYLISCS